ncbi:ABC transporter substrate-binding protein [Paenibacillus humicola]|uniref:ABC transporter substrate-binding protein n=1 Tax=Paenibacillus humicola TaxID=3110540 RepID=UPI00237AB0A4|nr:extracellular solute-binding protein [Paenibacillus humicola]
MMKNKWMSAFSLIVLSTALMAGCSSGGNEPETKKPDTADGSKAGGAPQQISLRVGWWGSQDRANRTLNAIKLFEQQNPNIKISAEFLGWDGYWEKMSTEAAAKNLPDVMQMDDAYLPDYVQRGLLEDMTPYAASGALNLQDVDDSYVAAGRIDNKLYALSLGANAVAIAYDPAMFEKAGVPELKPGYTWDEYADTARQLQQKLGKGVYGMPLSDDIDSFKQFLMERGAYLYNKDGTGLGYDDDKLVAEWFTYWNKQREDKVAPPPDMTASLTALEDQLIVHRKAPFLTLHSNEVVAVTQSANRPIKLIEYPSYPGGQKPQYLKPSQYFSVTSDSKQKDAAIKFIDFFTNDLKANEALGGERGVPIAGKVREDLKKQLDPAAKIAFDYVDYVSKNFPPLTNKDPAAASEINDTLYKSISDQVNYGQLTPEQAAKAFREQAEKIFKPKK